MLEVLLGLFKSWQLGKDKSFGVSRDSSKSWTEDLTESLNNGGFFFCYLLIIEFHFLLGFVEIIHSI